MGLRTDGTEVGMDVQREVPVPGTEMMDVFGVGVFIMWVPLLPDPVPGGHKH
jgi:hypothetical protein